MCVCIWVHACAWVCVHVRVHICISFDFCQYQCLYVETTSYTSIRFQSPNTAITVIFFLSVLVNPFTTRWSPGHRVFMWFLPAHR